MTVYCVLWNLEHKVIHIPGGGTNLWLAELLTHMLMSSVELLSTVIILLSTLYTASKTHAIWQQYRGTYGRLLVGVPLVSIIFGVAHVGEFLPFPHGLLATTETVAVIGVLVVIAGLGYIHPRVGYSGGEIR